VSLPQDLQHLLAVQAVDSQIDRARTAIAALDTGQATAAAFNAAKPEADSLRAAAVTAQAEQKDAEMRGSTIDTKRAKVEKSMSDGSVMDARELQNLQKELEMLGRQKSDAEDKELLAMEAAENAVKAAEAAEQKQAKLASRYKKIRAAYKDEHARLSAEVAEYEKARVIAAKPVPAALLTRYDAIRARKGGIGAALLGDDGSCGACHTRINTNLADDARAGKAVQLCEYCGRILIPPPPPA